MGSGAGGGVVVALGDWADDFESAALLAQASGHGGSGDPVQLVFVGHFDAAMERLASHGDVVRVLIVDPKLAVAAPELALRLFLTLALNAQKVRVVLWGRPTATVMHGVALCSRWLACELLVRGVDDGRLPEMVRGETGRKENVNKPELPIVALVESLPSRLRDAWSWVAQDPDRATVKGVAGRVGLTRRSLERWHRSLGAPAPGRLLRTLRNLLT